MDISRVRQREMLPRLLGQLAARSRQVLNIAAVAGAIGSLTPQKIAQAAPSTLTEYGHLLETFAVGEILKQVSWSDAPVAAGYFRTESGDEVDLVLERDDGQVIAFEIKAGTRVSGEDPRGLRFLKERLGSRLQESVIFYTGEYAYQHDDWIWILPLSRLWTSTRHPSPGV